MAIQEQNEKDHEKQHKTINVSKLPTILNGCTFSLSNINKKIVSYEPKERKQVLNFVMSRAKFSQMFGSHCFFQKEWMLYILMRGSFVTNKKVSYLIV